MSLHVQEIDQQGKDISVTDSQCRWNVKNKKCCNQRINQPTNVTKQSQETSLVPLATPGNRPTWSQRKGKARNFLSHILYWI